MHRSKRLVVLAHCILNQNSVVRGLARAPGAFPEIVRFFMDKGAGIIQLPCPEFAFSGEGRPSRTRQDYDTVEYRRHCTSLLRPVVDQLADYTRGGYEVTGIVGIQASPSCALADPRGIFMEVLLDLLDRAGITAPLVEVPESYGENPGADKAFLEELPSRF